MDITIVFSCGKNVVMNFYLHVSLHICGCTSLGIHPGVELFGIIWSQNIVLFCHICVWERTVLKWLKQFSLTLALYESFLFIFSPALDMVRLLNLPKLVDV